MKMESMHIPMGAQRTKSTERIGEIVLFCGCWNVRMIESYARTHAHRCFRIRSHTLLLFTFDILNVHDFDERRALLMWIREMRNGEIKSVCFRCGMKNWPARAPNCKQTFCVFYSFLFVCEHTIPNRRKQESSECSRRVCNDNSKWHIDNVN